MSRGVTWHVYDRVANRDRFFDTRREAFAWVDATFADPRGIVVARCGPDEDYIVRDFANPPFNRLKEAAHR